MNSLGQTIAAPITAPGGAVGLVRLSGPNSVTIAETVSTWKLSNSPWFQSTYSKYKTGDDGLVVAFPVGHSFTGEETVELSLHGSQVSITALVEACMAAGARMAEPGEFTYRAFMNGRLDLSQAEGVRDTVEAQSSAQLRQANLLRNGKLKLQISAIRNDLIGILAAIEASTDFSEEVGELDRVSALATLRNCRDLLNTLASSLTASRLIRHGITVAIVGRPNVGKSSLLNAITHSDRAIVTPIAGTTRDTISELVDIGGILVQLVDTAGFRDSQDDIESLGIERSRSAAENADHVWFVYDASVGWTPDDEAEFASVSRPTTVVANKCDLGAAGETSNHMKVSAQTGEGLPQLLATLRHEISATETPVLNQRHGNLVQEALSFFDLIESTLTSEVPDDLATVGLRSAIRALGEITGDTAPPDVIDRIFHDFCIGK